MTIVRYIRQRRARARREAENRRRRDKELDELGDFLFAYIRSMVHALGDEHSADN